MATLPIPTGSLTGGLAGLGGDFLTKAVGGAPNIGGTLGGLAGSAFFGPLGALGGSFLGNTLGSVFGFGKKKPPHRRTSFYYDFDKDSSTLIREKGIGDSVWGPIQGLVNNIGSTTKNVLSTLGIAPIVPGFSFGNWQGTSGFLLPNDPYAVDKTNVLNIIGEKQLLPEYLGVRAFGPRGGRSGFPTGEQFMDAAQSTIDEIVRQSIVASDLTNANVLEKLGLPTEMNALKARLPGYDFGADFDLGAQSTFGYKDLSRMGLSGLSGMFQPQPVLGARPLGPHGTRLMGLYNQMRPQMATAAQRPSYYGGAVT